MLNLFLMDVVLCDISRRFCVLIILFPSQAFGIARGASNELRNRFEVTREGDRYRLRGKTHTVFCLSYQLFKTIAVGENAEIQCKANQSLQSETVVWSRKGKWLTSTKHLTLATNGHMIIRQATYNLSNTYKCNVRSRLLAPMATLFQRVVVTVKGKGSRALQVFH